MKKLILLFFIALSIQFSFGSPWNQKSKLPASGRHRGTGIAIGDKGYIGLGHMNGSGNNIVYDDWWEFDPATNSWTQKASYPAGTYGSTVFSIGYKGYVGGGTAYTNEFFEYNPATNQWTPIADCLESPGDETAFTVNGKAYITSGSTLVEYDPTIDIWTYKASPPISGWAITSFGIQNSGYLKVNNSLYEYKPSIDQWTPRATFPGIVTNGGPSFTLNNKGYLLTGYSSFLNPVFSEMWEYDPATNGWTQMDDFPGTSRRFAVAFAINNKGYFGTGTNGTNMNDFWEYNPELEGVDIADIELISLSAYPNPATEQITFSNLPLQQGTQLSIYNSFGQIISSETVNTSDYIFLRNNLSSGTYFYTLSTEQNQLTKGSFIFK
jgi:N-acetylneuraminic acid mutarotase